MIVPRLTVIVPRAGEVEADANMTLTMVSFDGKIALNGFPNAKKRKVPYRASPPCKQLTVCGAVYLVS